MRSLNQNGLAPKIELKKAAEFYQEAPKTDDGRNYLMKVGRFGIFFAHPDYPKVKDAKPAQFKPEFFKKIYGNPPKAADGSAMIIRAGRFGEFWAHANYPKVKEIKKVDKKRVIAQKKQLGLL